MQYCPSCRVHIAGDKRCCPLCGGKLEGTGDPKSEIFPQLAPYRPVARRVLRILTLTGAGATAVCVLVNLLVGTEVWWSLFVAAGVACGILTAALGIAYRRDIPQNIAWETALAILLAILWDAATGWRGWSLDFVFPCVCATGLLMEIALGLIMKMPVYTMTGPLGALGLADWCRGFWFCWAGANCSAVGAVCCLLVLVSGRTADIPQAHRLGRSSTPVPHVKTQKSTLRMRLYIRRVLSICQIRKKSATFSMASPDCRRGNI